MSVWVWQLTQCHAHLILAFAFRLNALNDVPNFRHFAKFSKRFRKLLPAQFLAPQMQNEWTSHSHPIRADGVTIGEH
jgi:hypothetical protein